MNDEQLQEFLRQILEVQRNLQEGQLRMQEAIARSTANIDRLERIVLRHEGVGLLAKAIASTYKGKLGSCNNESRVGQTEKMLLACNYSWRVTTRLSR